MPTNPSQDLVQVVLKLLESQISLKKLLILSLVTQPQHTILHSISGGPQGPPNSFTVSKVCSWSSVSNLPIILHFSAPSCSGHTRKQYLILCERNQESFCITTFKSHINTFSAKHFWGLYNNWSFLVLKVKISHHFTQEITFWKKDILLWSDVQLDEKQCIKG